MFTSPVFNVYEFGSIPCSNTLMTLCQIDSPTALKVNKISAEIYVSVPKQIDRSHVKVSNVHNSQGVAESRITYFRGGGGGGGLLPIYDIVRICMPKSPIFQRCQVNGKLTFFKEKYMTGPIFHH